MPETIISFIKREILHPKANRSTKTAFDFVKQFSSDRQHNIRSSRHQMRA